MQMATRGAPGSGSGAAAAGIRASSASASPPPAIAQIEDVLRREPDNLAAWGLLYQFAHGFDPAAARRATAARERLDPLNAGSR